MPAILCPSCHLPIQATEVLRHCGPLPFWQCPECDACFPLAAPVEAAAKVVDELVTAQ